MMNKPIKSEITAVTTVKQKIKMKDASGNIVNVDLIYNQIKIDTAQLDYEEMNKFNPLIAQTLLNIQPMPFKSITFDEQPFNGGTKMKNLCANIKLFMKLEDRSYEGIDLQKLIIKKIIVNVKQNIPIYTFVVWVPVDDNAANRKYLSEFFKQTVEVEFFERGDDANKS